jgi:CDP-diacylglycerol--glycerol-3-phosphate 3-phosphatidyltransferase
MKLSMIITVSRFYLIPVFIFFYCLPWGWSSVAAFAVFTIAALSDWLDGYYARKYNETSRFGAFLDPVADKILVAVALVMFVGEGHLHFIAIPSAVIICREIAVSALREWMAEIGASVKVSVQFIGKVKTFFQMFAMGGLFVTHITHSFYFEFIAIGSLWIAAILSLWSMFIYLQTAWPKLHFD